MGLEAAGALPGCSAQRRRMDQYCYERRWLGYEAFEVVSSVVPPGTEGRSASYKALTPSIPGAAWYEREIADLFGLEPEGHLRTDPLVLPRGAGQAPPRPGWPPSSQTQAIVLDETALPAHLAGEGVFTLPYGPVRSGVFEAVQFLVETPGEDIPHLRSRVYHKHRGIEVRFQGMSPADGVLLAERVEGVASVAHAMAFSQAVESLSPGEVLHAIPPGALLVRAVHAELERLANHLDSTARHTEAAGQAVAYSRLTWHKERIMRLRGDLCGQRFGRGVVVPGGVARPPSVAPSAALGQLASIEADLRARCSPADGDLVVCGPVARYGCIGSSHRIVPGCPRTGWACFGTGGGR